MMRAVDWPAAAEQPRSGPQSALPSGSPRAEDAAPADEDELNGNPRGGSGSAAYPNEVAEAPGSSKEKHSGNPQSFAALWPRAMRAARQLSVWPSSVCLAIQDWTERFWQVCSCFILVNMCSSHQHPVEILILFAVHICQ